MCLDISASREQRPVTNSERRDNDSLCTPASCTPHSRALQHSAAYSAAPLQTSRYFSLCKIKSKLHLPYNIYGLYHFSKINCKTCKRIHGLVKHMHVRIYACTVTYTPPNVFFHGRKPCRFRLRSARDGWPKCKFDFLRSVLSRIGKNKIYAIERIHSFDHSCEHGGIGKKFHGDNLSHA
jgi:hypothetical protein